MMTDREKKMTTNIKSMSGNIFDSECDILVNPVNIMGVSGAGLAKQFKRRFPESQIKYELFCSNGVLGIGHLLHTEEKGKQVVYFPTKSHWKDPSKMEYIESGMAALARYLKSRTPTSIAIPMLGCGLGGLDWNEVKPVIVSHLEGLKGLTVELYEG